MKLEEASIISTALVEHGAKVLTTPEIYAVKLGIEAMNFKQAWEKGQYFPPGYLLPGETRNNNG